MRSSIDGVLNDFFGASRPAAPDDAAPQQAQQTQEPNDALRDALDAMQAQTQSLAARNREVLADITRMTREMEKDGLAEPAKAEVQSTPASDGAKAEGFDGVCAELEEELCGQTAFLQELEIAFKRPFVMGTQPPRAKNAFLVTGVKASGKHTAVKLMTQKLAQRSVLTGGEVQTLNLALYPTAQQEKLFLQDLYMALAGDGEVLVLDSFEKCHPGFLTAVSNLVIRGSHPLASRYVLQKGRLIDAGNALVSDAVSELTPQGKYLILITEKTPAQVAEVLGAPFLNALGDICTTRELQSADIDKIALKAQTALRQRVQAQLKLEPAFDSNLRAFLASHCTPQENVAGIYRFTDKIYAALAQYKLKHNCKAGLEVTLRHDGVLWAQFGADEEPTDLFSLLPQSYRGEMQAVKAELDEIVGLTEIKQYILSLEDNFTVQARRKAQGMKTAAVSMHMIFTGNPGTGKTTIARLVSRYLKAIGVLSGGQLVEVTRADLVGKYVGHTAPLTESVLQSAIGGVLFIDEAYSLYRGKDDSFGLECIDTLVKGIEDNRDNLIVILAGYSREMEQFLTSNSGLKSRFPNIIHFPDYTGDELLQISRLIAKGKGYAVQPDAEQALLAYYTAVQAVQARDAGNGRLARNTIEEAVLRQSKRVVHDENAALNELRREDFDLPQNISAEPQQHEAASHSAVQALQADALQAES